MSFSILLENSLRQSLRNENQAIGIRKSDDNKQSTISQLEQKTTK